MVLAAGSFGYMLRASDNAHFLTTRLFFFFSAYGSVVIFLRVLANKELNKVPYLLNHRMILNLKICEQCSVTAVKF